MSQVAAHRIPADDDANAPHVAARSRIDPDLVRFGAGAGSKLYVVLLAVGLLCLALTLILGMSMDGALKQALGAYHVGVMLTLYLALGSIGFVMILHQVNAGWASTVRRPLEAMGSVVPLCLLLFVPVLVIELAKGGVMFQWLHAPPTDHVAAHKAPFLNVGFFLVRAVFYFAVWSFFGLRLWKYSRRQDETGDKWLSARARFISSFGIPLLALTSAFASFDWMMSLDFHWYSTMFGVYFFAGALLSTIAALALILSTLKGMGKLGDAVNAEHLHDVGKLLLSFTVFWAYIAFGQYFLIWYSNIPEETGWFWLRQETGGWNAVFILLCFGHFVVPFLFLLFRRVKRTPALLSIAAAWLLLMHVVDVFFVIKPALGLEATERVWLDLVGAAGPVCLFLGAVVWRITGAPLIPINDPRLHESLDHKNYV